MGIRWSVIAPWGVAVVASAVFLMLTMLRMDLQARREEWRRAAVETNQMKVTQATCAQLSKQVAAAERDTERARAFLRQDLLVPRALLALDSARPPGIGIDSITWRTDYLPEGPCVTLEVGGWAATPVERQATRAWDGWVHRLKATLPWEAPLTPLSGPFWSRRRSGTEPTLAFRASLQTRPTPIPAK